MCEWSGAPKSKCEIGHLKIYTYLSTLLRKKTRKKTKNGDMLKFSASHSLVVMYHMTHKPVFGWWIKRLVKPRVACDNRILGWGGVCPEGVKKRDTISDRDSPCSSYMATLNHLFCRRMIRLSTMTGIKLASLCRLHHNPRIMSELAREKNNITRNTMRWTTEVKNGVQTKGDNFVGGSLQDNFGNLEEDKENMVGCCYKEYHWLMLMVMFSLADVLYLDYSTMCLMPNVRVQSQPLT